MKRTDAATNVTCYAWDALHRLTQVTYPSGPNSAATPSKGFVYDNAVPYAISVSNPLGRLTAAYIGPFSSYTMAEAFGYDARGEATDFYVSPVTGYNHWYHTQQSYFANGVSGGAEGYYGTGTTQPFTTTLGAALDGEGRLYGIWDSSATIWAGTTYNSASQPTLVNLIDGSESFGYDPAGRMSGWTSKAGTANTQTGGLTWNANGTVQQLVMTDTYNSTNQQTCSYTYDDLGRLGPVNAKGVNCVSGSTTLWQQTFGYDAFGNITKSGTGNWTVNYNTSTNQIQGWTYDGMGNLKNSGDHTYTYDAEGRPVTVDSVQVMYDAFERPVEEESGGTYSQILYSPSGQKFAFMSGSTVDRYLVPLVAGMQAVYTAAQPASVAYYRHSDWLGSNRFSATTSGTVYFDEAYAPFGEHYAGTGTSDLSFTGQTQDTVTGLYDFPFRQQHPVQGRWLVPDPAGLAAVDITNPQTWNRYAYVMNNPLGYIDPLGLYCAVPGDYGHFSIGCSNVGMGWGPGIFVTGYQWVSGSAQQPTQIPGTDPGGTDTPGWQMSQTNGGWQVVGMGLPGGSWFGPGGSYGGNSVSVNPNPRPTPTPPSNPPASQYRCEQGQLLGAAWAGATEAVAGASNEVKQLVYTVAQNPGQRAIAGAAVSQAAGAYFALEAGTAATIGAFTSEVVIPAGAVLYTGWRIYQGAKAAAAYIDQHPCQ